MKEQQTKDFRDYFFILLKRKRYFFIPFLVLFTIITAVALLLPAVYESTSTILIEDQQIPPEFVRSTVTGFADQRIQSLTQQILSRTRLWEIIQQFKLYLDLKEKYTREEIIKKMRENIRLDTISAEVAAGQKAPARKAGQAGITIAFSISYRGKSPEMVQKVAGTLASLYLEQNLKTREAQAKTTTQFLEAEAKELREHIRIMGGKIAAFKEAHEGIQPELYQFNLSQAERLEQDIKQIDNQIRTIQDRKIYLEGQLATVKPDSPIIGSSGERILDPRDRLRALEVKLADLQAKFSPDHPDVRQALREKAELEKLVGKRGGSPSLKRQKLVQLKAELAQKQGKYSDQHPDVRKLKNEIARLEQEPEKAEPVKPVTNAENPAYISLTTQIESAKNEITSLQRQRLTLKKKREMYNQRLEESPKLEQEYFALQRDYKNSTDKYQEVMNKILEARISEGMEEHQKGEKFILIDPASYPQKPVKPKRMLIILAGFILSLGAGLGTVALVEQLDHSVKNADELSAFTGLPVLGTIIRIHTKEELTLARHKRQLAWMISGLVLILGLTLFHFLYMDLWVLTAKLLRLAQKYT
jgi:succinoglycan biosynthesis transport protein ExoP